jgi:hypothetical protein
MKIEIAAACLFCLALLPACSTTSTTSTASATTTSEHQTLEQRLSAKYASVDTTSAGEPTPPAEGPEDIPAEGPGNPDHNPILVPTPLLRYWASSRTP